MEKHCESEKRFGKEGNGWHREDIITRQGSSCNLAALWPEGSWLGRHWNLTDYSRRGDYESARNACA